MTDKRFHVIFSGKIKPHMDIETVKSNLSLALNMAESKLEKLFSGEEVMLKHCSSIKEAERITELFDHEGALCYVRDTLASSSNAAVAAGSESSLIRLLKENSDDAEQHSSVFTRLFSGLGKRKRA